MYLKNNCYFCQEIDSHYIADSMFKDNIGKELEKAWHNRGVC